MKNEDVECKLSLESKPLKRIFLSMKFGDLKDANNKWSKLFDYGIKPIEKEFEDYDLAIIRADKNLHDLALKENVRRGIESSDIVLCVLTKNENIFWEIGYAEALGIPIAFMLDDSELKHTDIPILAGQPNFFQYNLDFVDKAPNNDSDVFKSMRAALKPYIEKAITYTGHRNVGQNKYKIPAYSNRELIQLDMLISSAKYRVDILETNLDWFVNCGKFKIDDKEKQSHPFNFALKNGCDIRIVTMDPEAIISEFRAKQLGKQIDVPGYRENLRESIRKLYHAFRNEIGDRFNLKIYSELPLQITSIIDDKIITGIIARGRKSRGLIHIEFSKYLDGVNESFLNHFESIYNSSNDASSFNWVVK
jgi:hypothetical protein